MSKSFLVNEIYPCLQGEGVNLGKPAVLVRFQICNLRCVWCDTPYTHTNKSDPVDVKDLNGKQNFFRISFEDLIEKIHSYSIKHIIFTGGEPTLQNLAMLAKALLQLDVAYTFEVESNGTQIPHLNLKDFSEKDYELMQWNISPKYGSSGQEINAEALTFWASKARENLQVYFKFVVAKDSYEKELEQVKYFEKQFQIPKSSILLMPEGTTLDSQIQNTWLVDICLANLYRYTPRLHVLIYGSLRGV